MLNPCHNSKEFEIRARLMGEFPFFSRNCLKIRPKTPEIGEDGQIISGLVPFVLNRAQVFVHEQAQKQFSECGRVRLILLKGRQQGLSTYVGGRYIWRVIHQKGVRAFILTHDMAATANLFEMTQRFYANLLPEIKPFVDRNNAKELSFPNLDSGYKVGTAGRGNVGRSQTINFLHGSEVAFWEYADEIASGIMQAVPLDNSEIILESTTRGEGNYFHTQWELAVSGDSDFRAVFIPFYWQPEYSRKLDDSFRLDEEDIYIRDLYGLTNEQMFWRQKKIAEIGSSLFKQEYPFTPEEAFKATTEAGIIPIEHVERARKEKVEGYGPVLIGVDCARSENGDRNSIIVRQGRLSHSLISFRTADTMQVVAKVVEYINTHSPFKVFVDVVGIGAGIVDRLRELGYSNIVHPVNAGAAAFDKNKYKNKKAEMYGVMKDWFEDGPVQIPDMESLARDICALKWTDNSNSQKVAESKSDLKKRMGASYSPDEAEALANTFAYPVSASANVKFQPQKVFSLGLNNARL